MKSPEQMGGSPEQPKEEPMKDKEETPEKPASPESYNEVEWNKLKQGGAAFVINKGKEMGVPQEELDRFAEDVIARETENQNYGFVYRFRKNMRIGAEEEIRAAGAKAYQSFFDAREFGSAMAMAEDVYGRNSEEWRRANEASEAELQKTEQKRERKEEPMEEKERRVTTPEEAAEMTRQRRKEYGLGEITNLTPEKVEEIDAAIGELLKRLDEYDFDSFSPEVQDEWYWVEQEANAGKDRELAKAVLEKFLSTLKGKVE